MVGSLVHQLTDGASAEELEKAGMGAYYTDHGVGIYPQAAAGFPYNAASMAVKGDPIADLTEDLAADKEENKCNQMGKMMKISSKSRNI